MANGSEGRGLFNGAIEVIFMPKFVTNLYGECCMKRHVDESGQMRMVIDNGSAGVIKGEKFRYSDFLCFVDL
jgi:hypothetical protein